jgi:chloramphenicol-sensitive protein RarD
MNKKGIAYSSAAYLIWGFFPIYWKLIKHVPALQLLGHRIVWSFILLGIMFLASRKYQELRALVTGRKAIQIYAIAAILIGLNWFLYVWSVNAGYIVEASLGYFINPLFSVLLGVLFLKERLRPFQWVAIGLAASGVIYLTFMYGRLPWIALSLAFTFGSYGLVKKIAPLPALHGLVLETGFLFLPALFFLIHQNAGGQGAFLHTGTASDLLMAGAGLVTTVPLLLFSWAAQRIPLTMVGLLHYITPTCQLLIGVLIYQESFNTTRAIGFGIVWLGLLVFMMESLWRHNSSTPRFFSEFEG